MSMSISQPSAFCVLLFTPCPVTRYAMHRIYAKRINSRGMSRVFCDLRSQKTPRGILPVNSNIYIVCHNAIFLLHHTIYLFFSVTERLLVTVHTPLSREVFWHEYAKIPRHTSQNFIAAGNLERILATLL